MDIPPPDPQKLLDHWMECERGETPPGRSWRTSRPAGCARCSSISPAGADPRPAAPPLDRPGRAAGHPRPGRDPARRPAPWAHLPPTERTIDLDDLRRAFTGRVGAPSVGRGRTRTCGRRPARRFWEHDGARGAADPPEPGAAGPPGRGRFPGAGATRASHSATPPLARRTRRWCMPNEQIEQDAVFSSACRTTSSSRRTSKGTSSACGTTGPTTSTRACGCRSAARPPRDHDDDRRGHHQWRLRLDLQHPGSEGRQIRTAGFRSTPPFASLGWGPRSRLDVNRSGVNRVGMRKPVGPMAGQRAIDRRGDEIGRQLVLATHIEPRPEPSLCSVGDPRPAKAGGPRGRLLRQRDRAIDALDGVDALGAARPTHAELVDRGRRLRGRRSGRRRSGSGRTSRCGRAGSASFRRPSA